MGLLDKIFGTGNKIKVQFIDNINGQTIGVSEMTAGQLPETFSVQTTMYIQDNEWIVEEAIPENSTEFIKTKSLVLKMRKVEKMNPNDIWFTLPTISNEYPQLTQKTKETEFDISIHEDDYRQNEFLNQTSLPKIEEEFIGIKDIWNNHSKKNDDYTLFKNCHVRKTIGSPNLTINFNELKSLLNCSSIGQVVINGNILSNGFSIKTENTIYFGILKDDIVLELCIAQWNDNSINEILEINKTFNSVFVNWSHCDLIENG
ncbi:MAG: hypothetical protein JNJ85_08780 [Candidatus Kapabacteria bacterium]|nr:hypothetical protein [Candidatus Kapabacteria bacterium]